MIKRFLILAEQVRNSEQPTIMGEIFSNEELVDCQFQCFVFSNLTFKNVRFTNVDFTGSYFFDCNFEDCQMNEITFRKSQFFDSTFKETRILNSNFMRAEFEAASFENSQIFYVLSFIGKNEISSNGHNGINVEHSVFVTSLRDFCSGLITCKCEALVKLC